MNLALWIISPFAAYILFATIVIIIWRIFGNKKDYSGDYGLVFFILILIPLLPFVWFYNQVTGRNK